MAEIKLHSKQYSGMVALVDDDDFERINQYRWNIWRNPNTGLLYARTCIEGQKVLMHKLLMYSDKTLRVKHVNGDTLDNRTENLKFEHVCDTLGNRNPHSIYARGKKWVAKYKGKYLGTFASKEDAEAACIAARG